jgi:hypothetical protein
MSEEKQRRGKFTIDGEMMRVGDFEILKFIMDRVVVFHTEARFDRDEITYFAYHPSFDVLSYGLEYPKYEAIVTIQGANEVSVEWRKVE